MTWVQSSVLQKHNNKKPVVSYEVYFSEAFCSLNFLFLFICMWDFISHMYVGIEFRASQSYIPTSPTFFFFLNLRQDLANFPTLALTLPSSCLCFQTGWGSFCTTAGISGITAGSRISFLVQCWWDSERSFSLLDGISSPLHRDSSFSFGFFSVLFFIN